MDAKRNFRKRKTLSSSLPSNPQSEIFTRSKAQLFIHQKQSTQSLSLDADEDDKLVLKDLLKKSKLTEGTSIADDDEHSQNPIKDLRSRRVYSPRSDIVSSSKRIPSVYLEESAVGSSCRDQKITDSGMGSSLFVENNEDSKGSRENGKSGEGFSSEARAKDVINSVLSSIVNEYQSDEKKEKDPCFNDAVGVKIEQTEIPDVGFSCIGQNLDHMKTESLVTSSNLQDAKPVCGNVSEKIDDFTQQSVLTTPPDIDICGNLGVNEDEGIPVEGVNQNVFHHDKDVDLKVCGQEDAGKEFCVKVDQTNESVLKTKSVLRPHLQRKLFKTPGSISYRRLLPFLVNMTKDDSGTPELGDYKKVPSQNEGSSKHGYKTDSCPMSDTVESDSKEPKLASPEDLPVLPMQLDASKQIGDLSEEGKKTTPPNAVICGNSEVKEDGGKLVLEASQHMYHIRDTYLTECAQNAGEGSCLRSDKRNLVLERKSVLPQHLQRKLFKTTGSFSYKRMLPFLLDLTKDDTGTPKVDHLHSNQNCLHVKRFQHPLSSDSQEVSQDELKIDSCPTHDLVESRVLADNTLGDPSNKLSFSDEPKLTPPKDVAELPMQLDAEVAHGCLSAPSVNKHIPKLVIDLDDKSPSDSNDDLHSVTVDFYHVKNVENDVDNGVLNKVKNQKAQRKDSELQSESALDCDDRKQPISPKKSRSVSTCLSESQNLNHIPSETLENETGSSVNNTSDDAEVLNDLHDSRKEIAKPSDTMIFEKSDLAEDGGNKAEIIMKTAVCDPRMPSSGSNNNVNGIGKMKNLSESNTTLVLNPCSRIKLLKYSGSFSYRRLLPFLENTIKDNSCVSVNGVHPILKKNLDQASLPPISSSNSQITSVNNSKGCVFRMGHFPGISGSQQKSGLAGLDDLLNDNCPNKRSFPPIPESQSSNDSCKVIPLHGERHILNEDRTLGSLKDSAPTVDASISSLHRISNEVFSREEDAASTSHHSLAFSKVHGNSSPLISSNGEKPLEINGSYMKLSQPSALGQLVPAAGAKNGILKRNPRGCRGLCTCLNCASFRLHAERAFEFSKNQLLDAKEITLDLVKELSYLRNVLQGCTQSTNYHSVLGVDQVKEACTRAFAAEQIAKDRLAEMNDDLNIHCRITCLQPPRVRFSDHVEEKVIPRR
ncbi:hypothetical protein L6164_025271 [Bauhinia variegata]|uniref:Uncharacterized protein n=1 Tax=Bauhinia variegata TaxID=167791 RepID=A0ACB9M1G6_BAUVA|nr:hypothetical protein L6164_025271 [Bauhinia variegata]